MIDAFNDFYYIFDAEGTLFFTDDLNNESYNYVLMQNKFKPIENRQRITRQSVKDFYPAISKQLLNRIVQQKQKYFINHIEKISGNYFLFNIIKKIGKDKSILWTASNCKKLEYIITKFDMESCFRQIIYSNKKDITKDLNKICEFLCCEHKQLLIFENDFFIAEELKRQHTNCLLFICA